jgi:hypothetical protein
MEAGRIHKDNIHFCVDRCLAEARWNDSVHQGGVRYAVQDAFKAEIEGPEAFSPYVPFIQKLFVQRRGGSTGNFRRWKPKVVYSSEDEEPHYESSNVCEPRGEYFCPVPVNEMFTNLMQFPPTSLGKFRVSTRANFKEAAPAKSQKKKIKPGKEPTSLMITIIKN